jgi:hypothetical protein
MDYKGMTGKEIDKVLSIVQIEKTKEIISGIPEVVEQTAKLNRFIDDIKKAKVEGKTFDEFVENIQTIVYH